MREVNILARATTNTTPLLIINNFMALVQLLKSICEGQ